MSDQFPAHQLTQNVKLLQKAVLIHQEKFLILRRSSTSATRPDLWDLPGGNSEWPQTSENVKNPHKADITREILEETGIQVDQYQFIDDLYFGTYFEATKQIFTVIVGWKVILPADFDPKLVQLSEEHSEAAWISPLEFDAYDFGFAGESEGFIRGMVQKISL